MRDFIDSPICLSRGVCKDCRLNTKFRESLLKDELVSERDFPCPIGYKLNVIPNKRFGDYIEIALKFLGLKKLKGCGCNKRQKCLNRIHERILSFFRSK